MSSMIRTKFLKFTLLFGISLLLLLTKRLEKWYKKMEINGTKKIFTKINMKSKIMQTCIYAFFSIPKN
jgi:hypothetical protein